MKDYRLSADVSSLLTELDSLLSRSSEITAAKEARINSLRQSLAKASPADRRYWLASDLYEEYSAFDSDSAMAYADMAYELARSMGRRDLMDDMQLNRAYIFSATGLLDEAKECLEKVDENALSTEMLWKYCDRVLFLQTHRDQYIDDQMRDTAYPAASTVCFSHLSTISPLKILTTDGS